jgi:tripartite-type tricarboxylate transporter receptor subunit TctC
VFAWRALVSVALVAVPIATTAAAADEFPTKPLRVVVPYPAGGIADKIAREVAEQLQLRLKQPVVVENRSGAAGNIGFDYVARQPADGYTLLLAPGLQPHGAARAVQAAELRPGARFRAGVAAGADAAGAAGEPGAARRQRQGPDRLFEEHPARSTTA